MTEEMTLKEPIFKLVIRYSNGETASYIVAESIDPRLVTPDVRYGVITSVSIKQPNECVEVVIVNMRDVSSIKTERVGLDQVAGERRTAGIHATGPSGSDDRFPKLSQLRFV